VDPLTLNTEAQRTLGDLLTQLENHLGADVLTLVGPIRDGVEHKVRNALEPMPDKRTRLAVMLQTGGGVVEVAERMVNIIRHFYAEVVFIIPDVAMSAGTVFAMSGDSIMMDYFSCLGPIDPQVERDGKLVPALSYLVQYDRLIQKASEGKLTDAEFAILSRFDLAELHQFEMARDLSIELLVGWLARYKFKDWTVTETRQHPVTPEYKEERARDIANVLMNNRRWGSHGRGIPMKVLREAEINLHIDDFAQSPELALVIRKYYGLVVDYMARNGIPHMAHSRMFI
jgi:hypothetical protein